MSLRTKIRQLLKGSAGAAAKGASAGGGLRQHWNRGVWCPIVGGLANQLICYRAGRMLADLHGIPLVADLSHFNLPATRPLLLPNFKPVIDIVIRNSSETASWSTQARDLLSQITVRDTPDFWHVDTQSRLRSCFLETPVSPICVDLWVGLAFQIQVRDHFRKPENNDKITFEAGCLSTLEKEFLREIKGCTHAVAVHVRRTDFANHDGGLLAPAGQYNEAIRYIEHSVGPCQIFLFSDDQAWCERHIAAAGKIRHSPVRGEENGHKDLYLASQCRHKVLTSESTFSQMIDCLSPYFEQERLIVRCSARVKAPIYGEYEHA